MNTEFIPDIKDRLFCGDIPKGLVPIQVIAGMGTHRWLEPRERTNDVKPRGSKRHH